MTKRTKNERAAWLAVGGFSVCIALYVVSIVFAAVDIRGNRAVSVNSGVLQIATIDPAVYDLRSTFRLDPGLEVRPFLRVSHEGWDGIAIALWPFLVALPLTGLVVLRRRWLPQRHPICRACQFDATGLTEPRCPECGAAVDLERPAYAPYAAFQFLIMAVQWIAIVLLTAPAIAQAVAGLGYGFWIFPHGTLDQHSWAPGAVRLGFMAFMSVPLILAVSCAYARRHRLRRLMRAVTGAAVVVGFVTSAYPMWIAQVIFRTHLPALNALADEIIESGTMPEPRRVGLYYFHELELREDGVKLTVAQNRGEDPFFFRAIADGKTGSRGDARYKDTMFNPFMFSQITEEWWYWIED